MYCHRRKRWGSCLLLETCVHDNIQGVRKFLAIEKFNDIEHKYCGADDVCNDE